MCIGRRICQSERASKKRSSYTGHCWFRLVRRQQNARGSGPVPPSNRKKSFKASKNLSPERTGELLERGASFNEPGISRLSTRQTNMPDNFPQYSTPRWPTLLRTGATATSGASLGILRNMFVPPPSGATRLGRIDIVSERGRWRSREQATTTTTATREPLAGLTFFVEDIERRQADIGNFLLAQRHFLTDCGVACRGIWSRPGCYRHSTRQRQRQSGRSQNRYRFAPLRGSLHARHLDSPG